MTTIASGNVGLNGVQVAGYQWVYGPINAVTIADAIEIRIRGRADIYTDLYEERCALYVVQSDGSTVRGTMYGATSALGTSETSEWTTTFANYTNTIAAGSVTDVAASDEDYIVIEIGADHDAAVANDGFDLEIGDTSSTNHMYVEFTETITLFDPAEAPTDVAYDNSGQIVAVGQAIADMNATITPGESQDSCEFAIESGALPPGVSLDTDTGVISGTPSARGTYTFTILAFNAQGSVESDSLSIRVRSTSGSRGNMKMEL